MIGSPDKPVPQRAGRHAVLTIVRDESVFLPIWLAYYSRYFAPEDIHVLDHGSTDGSTDGDGFVHIPVEHENVEMLWMAATVQAHQHRLLESYETVLFTDVDEIVAPEPRTGTLADYLERFQGDFVRCTGFELIHLRGSEPPFDPTRPVLAQRSHWFRSRMYSKPLVARVPLHWRPGFHSCEEGNRDPDPNLYLVHLHRMDYDLCLAKHRRVSRWRWSEIDLDRGWGYQNRITSPEEFDRWFYEDSHDPKEPMRIERIPGRWKGLF